MDIQIDKFLEEIIQVIKEKGQSATQVVFKSSGKFKIIYEAAEESREEEWGEECSLSSLERVVREERKGAPIQIESSHEYDESEQ